MPKLRVFINRRSVQERRTEYDLCKDMPYDLFHRKRRKSLDRRNPNRTLEQDYDAFLETLMESKSQVAP